MYTEKYGKAKEYLERRSLCYERILGEWMGGMGVYASIRELGGGVF